MLCSRWIIGILFLILVSPCWGATKLMDEGVNKGYINVIDCTGDGITCSRSGIKGILNVPVSGGGASQLSELSDVGTVSYTAGQYLRADGTDYDSASIQDEDLPSSITRDSEWDTISEIETATGVNIIINTEIDTEAELEGLLGDVTNVFTNNDGALSDDDLSDNNLSDLGDIQVTTPADGHLLLYDGVTDNRFENVVMSGDVTITAAGVTSLSTDSVADNEIDYTAVTLADFTDDVGYEEETHASEHAVGGADSVFPADPNADKFLKWNDATGQLEWDTPSGSGDVTDVGDCSSGACFTADGAGNSLYFEGSTADAYETLLQGQDVNSDITINLPSSSGTLLNKEQIDTEAEFESLLFSVFTPSDGALTDDDVTDDNVESMTTAGGAGTVPLSDGAGNLTMTDVLTEAELDAEAELEAQLGDVTNVYTNNDGSLDDDDVTLTDVQTACSNDFHNIGGTDDDVPEAGDFGNATDLDSNGAINTGAVTSAKIADDTITDDDIDNSTPADVMKAGAVLVLDGGGSAISTGEKKVYIRWPFNCTLTKITLLADTSTTTTIDVWKDSYANFPPTDADSLFDTESEPAISAALKSETTSFDSGEDSITAGDIMCVNVDANDNATILSIVFDVTKN